MWKAARLSQSIKPRKCKYQGRLQVVEGSDVQFKLHLVLGEGEAQRASPKVGCMVQGDGIGGLIGRRVLDEGLHKCIGENTK